VYKRRKLFVFITRRKEKYPDFDELERRKTVKPEGLTTYVPQMFLPIQCCQNKYFKHLMGLSGLLSLNPIVMSQQIRKAIRISMLLI